MLRMETTYLVYSRQPMVWSLLLKHVSRGSLDTTAGVSGCEAAMLYAGGY